MNFFVVAECHVTDLSPWCARVQFPLTCKQDVRHTGKQEPKTKKAVSVNDNATQLVQRQVDLPTGELPKNELIVTRKVVPNKVECWR